MSDEKKHQGTLLIVDDIPANVSVLFDFLIASGFKVLVAQDGRRALQKAEYAQPDLILMDVMMPGMDGFEACQHLKEKSETQDIPVIFMTALADTVDKVKGFSLGAADYITKPIQQEEVLARINTHLTFRRLQKALQEHTQTLEKRNMELDAFARTVAHDLKNPLNTVIGYSDELLEELSLDKQPTQEDLDSLKLVNESGRKMVNIIDALLMLAGASKQDSPEKEPLDMRHIVEQVIEKRLALKLRESQGKIDIPDDWPIAYGFAPWVEEVWSNYLSNGLKYGGHPPHLELGATALKDGKIEFWVKDNGPGLNAEAQQQLFTPFTRLHKDRAEGHGLGLSIVQQVVEKLEGEVGVESQLGHGSRFFFTLPAQA